MINLSPCVFGDVPDKVWFGKEVSYNHLRVFGCKAYVHVPSDEQSSIPKLANVSLLVMVMIWLIWSYHH